MRSTPPEGVIGVGAVLLSNSNLSTAPQFHKMDLARTGGTSLDGTWEGDLPILQGTPPGTYHVLVLADDPHVVVVTHP